MPPTYYRGCWHVVSRGFLVRYRHLPVKGLSSLPIELYIPKYFFTHAALLHQGSPHCAIFPTAASRRSLVRFSIPMWLIVLSNQLEIIGLVSRYLPNCLIPSGRICSRAALRSRTFPSRAYAVLSELSLRYPPQAGSFPDITHPSATRQQRSKLPSVTVRLACVKPAASVQSEP